MYKHLYKMYKNYLFFPFNFESILKSESSSSSLTDGILNSDNCFERVTMNVL